MNRKDIEETLVLAAVIAYIKYNHPVLYWIIMLPIACFGIWFMIILFTSPGSEGLLTTLGNFIWMILSIPFKLAYYAFLAVTGTQIPHSMY